MKGLLIGVLKENSVGAFAAADSWMIEVSGVVGARKLVLGKIACRVPRGPFDRSISCGFSVVVWSVRAFAELGIGSGGICI